MIRFYRFGLRTALCAALLTVAISAVVSAARTGASTYTVRRGDSLARIAARECCSSRCWPKIARANNIRKPYTILPGQVLQLPSHADAACAMKGPDCAGRVCASSGVNPGSLESLAQTRDGYAPEMLPGSQAAPTPISTPTAFPAPTSQTPTDFVNMPPTGQAIPNAFREPDVMKPEPLPRASLHQRRANITSGAPNAFFSER